MEMYDTADAVNGLTRSRRRGGSLPKVKVHSRAEMGEELRRHRRFLQERAQQQLGDTPEARLAVSTTVRKCLAVEEPHMDHALPFVLQILRNECVALRRRSERKALEEKRRAEAGGPVDPVSGVALVDVREAVDELPLAERQTLLLAFEGLSPGDIAILLGEKPKTVYVRLYRARRRVLIKTGRSSVVAGALVFSRTAFCRRPSSTTVLRNVMRAARGGIQASRAAVGRMEGLGSLATNAIAQTATAATLAALCAGWAVPAPHSITAPGAPSTVAVAPDSGGVLVANPVVTEAGPTAPTLLGIPNLGVSNITTTISSLAHHSATAETADDAQLVSAAPAPEDDQHRTIVALGIGRTCGCLTMFQSTDRGSSWSVAEGPPAGDQVILPPTYPSDPRIFIGTDANSGSPAFVASQFGALFTPINATLPPGNIALAAGFDHGDPRVLAAGATVVSSYRIGDAAATPVAIYPSQGRPASLATPTGSATTAVMMLLPSAAQVIGETAELAGSASTPRVVACDVASFACHTVSSVSLPYVGGLVLSSHYAVDRTMLAFGGSQVAVSSDGGATFSMTPTNAPVRSAALVGSTAWAVAAPIGAHVTLQRLEGNAWATLATAGTQLGTGGLVVALTSSQLLYLPDGLGFLCSLDGGQSWTMGCR